MEQDLGRSPSGRAGRASTEPQEGLGHSATIPNARTASCRLCNFAHIWEETRPQWGKVEERKWWGTSKREKYIGDRVVTGIQCFRYPEHIDIDEPYWCGEFVPAIAD